MPKENKKDSEKKENNDKDNTKEENKKENSKSLVYDTIIIGGGVSGFAAAMYSARLNLKTLVIAEMFGGTIVMTNHVENYPGIEKITGFELAEKIRNHALSYNVPVEEDRVEKISRGEKSLFKVETFSKKIFYSKTIIYATGSKYKELNAVGERKYFNRGVHYCALCDGSFYKNKIVAVIGGSDSAASDALVLAQHAKKVYIIYRKEKLRCEPVNYKRVIGNNKIEIIYNTNIKEFYGDERKNILQGAMLDKNFKSSSKLPLDGVFIAIGHTVISELAKQIGVALNEKSEVITDKDSKTNIPGFFAAGDVTNRKFKQAIIGVGESVIAAYSAYEYVTSNKIDY